MITSDDHWHKRPDDTTAHWVTYPGSVANSKGDGPAPCCKCRQRIVPGEGAHVVNDNPDLQGNPLKVYCYKCCPIIYCEGK